MNRTRRLVTVGIAALALAGLSTYASADKAVPLLNRPAKGSVAEFGGAARLPGDQTDTIQSAIQKSGAKNVILIIGDGMGDSEITIGRNYLVGAGGFLKGLDALPMTGQMTHYTVTKDGKPDYVGDSAATGSAWATGVKTYDNAVSVDIHGKAHQTILQSAKESGRATGDVTTSEIQDATPAVLVSNVSLRKCYGPEATTKSCPENALELGGKGSISEQLLDTRPDVTLGGGSKTFGEKAKAGQWKDKTLEQQAKDRGYNYITEKSALDGVQVANQDKPLLGLFDAGNLPVKYAPMVATKGGADKPAAKCTPEPKFEKVPALGTMTDKALSLLSKSDHGKQNGFFLQVESASIDKKDHAADACGQIGETDQINDAIGKALDFAKADGNTLVIVTADHAHTSQIVDDTPTDSLSVKLKTNEGADMIVSYGTGPKPSEGYTDVSQQHTGAQVRVAAYGPGAANVVGLIDQTDLYFIMKDGMDKSKTKGDGCDPKDPKPSKGNNHAGC